MKPAWRAAAVAYREMRGAGQSDHAAHTAAAAAIKELHPEFTHKEASAEAVRAVAFASTNYPDWFWAPLRVG